MQIINKIYFYFLILKITCMCRDVLPPSMSVQYLCVSYPQRPEEGKEFPGTGTINSCDHHVCVEN